MNKIEANDLILTHPSHPRINLKLLIIWFQVPAIVEVAAEDVEEN